MNRKQIPNGVTAFRIMGYLFLQDGPVTVEEISKTLFSTPNHRSNQATAYVILKSLLEKGFVIRIFKKEGHRRATSYFDITYEQYWEFLQWFVKPDQE